MIVYEKRTDNDEGTDNSSDMPSARMTLVRMVNRIPLLDGAEASACGLVQCVATKQSMWSSFGLSASHGTDQTASDLRLFVPTYAIRDSDSVASFFQNRSPHQLFELQDIEDGDDDQSEAENGEDDELAHRPKNRAQTSHLLPAHLRLGNILVVIQIHAHPSSLPLPTLSKSRLPLNDIAIDSAVEAGVVKCLQSLQKTNPALLLTPMQLKTTIRDTRYIPSAAAAMACVICKSKDVSYQKHFLKVIRGWTAKVSADTHRSDDSTDNEQEDHDLLDVSKLGPLLEAKLREICVATDGDKTTTPRKKMKANKMITRSSNRGTEAPLPTSPLRPQTSESWGCMSPSPVKVPRHRLSTSMEGLESTSSLNSEMAPSPVKTSTRTTKARIPPRESLDSLCTAFDECDNTDNQTIHGTSVS
ncbi:Histidine ATPase [Fragilaria crotonensis]|nr:Histidine ATPase [Fragilaria crotonensis]